MKKRVGMLYGKPIIVGDKNDQTVNEIYLSSKEISGGSGVSIPIIEYGQAENNKIQVITEIGTFEGRTGANNNAGSVSVSSSELLNYLKDKYNIYLKTSMDTIENNHNITVYSSVLNLFYERKDYIDGSIYEIKYTFLTMDGEITLYILK